MKNYLITVSDERVEIMPNYEITYTSGKKIVVNGDTKLVACVNNDVDTTKIEKIVKVEDTPETEIEESFI